MTLVRVNESGKGLLPLNLQTEGGVECRGVFANSASVILVGGNANGTVAPAGRGHLVGSTTNRRAPP